MFKTCQTECKAGAAVIEVECVFKREKKKRLGESVLACQEPEAGINPH